MMNWKEYRQEKVKKYIRAKEQGDIDPDIIPLLDLINSKEELTTLSSCSGRIGVIDTPEPGDKIKSKFLSKWHLEVDSNEIMDVISRGKETTWLITYPPIIHIACENLNIAEKVLNLGSKAGFKKCGVISLKKNIVEITSYDGLEMLVAVDGELFFDFEKIKVVVGFANERLLKGKKKLAKFEDVVKIFIGKL